MKSNAQFQFVSVAPNDNSTLVPTIVPVDGTPKIRKYAAKNLKRCDVQISNPHKYNGKMFVQVRIAEWDENKTFFYPLASIDSPAVSFKVMWKMAGDSSYVFSATAELDLQEKDPHYLGLQNWRFSHL